MIWSAGRTNGELNKRAENGRNKRPNRVVKPGRIRVGTPAVTTRRMKEEEMLDIADLINDALQSRDEANALENVRGKVRELTR
jgi:glycine hydroxymethyltransferase